MFLLSKLCFLWISSIVPICNDFQTLHFYLPDGRHYGKDPFSQCCSYFRFAAFFNNLRKKTKKTLSRSNEPCISSSGTFFAHFFSQF